MKRMISVMLAVLLLLSCTAIPFTVFAKKPRLYAPYQLFVSVPDNKAKTLRVSWMAVDDADGYQIFRSTNGKKNSYKQIATTKKCEYVDTGLKTQKVYYYAVRAFAKINGSTLFGAFSKDDCFTKITKEFALKKLKKAHEIYDQWIYCSSKYYDYNKSITRKKTYTDDDGTKQTTTVNYYLMTNKTITTKDALNQLLSKYFGYGYEEYVDELFVEEKGRLYIIEPEWGGPFIEYRELAKVRDLVQRDDYVTFTVLETWEDPYGRFYDIGKYSLSRNGNDWVFSDNSWFPGAY